MFTREKECGSDRNRKKSFLRSTAAQVLSPLKLLGEAPELPGSLQRRFLPSEESLGVGRGRTSTVLPAFPSCASGSARGDPAASVMQREGMRGPGLGA